MKNILKVTILFILIVSAFIIPSFAIDEFTEIPVFESAPNYTDLRTQGYLLRVISGRSNYFIGSNHSNTYVFAVNNSNVYVACDTQSTISYTQLDTNTNVVNTSLNSFDNTNNLYYKNITNYSPDNNTTYYCNVYSDLSSGLYAVREYIDNPPSIYTKNENVDEFIANTLISMGVKFDTPAYALSYASAAWDWCIDETNMESAHPFDEWNIESFVSYCNAQSNNYLNWYNGYKVSNDVTKALGEYIRQNIRSLTGLPAGITSLTGAYLPIYHYGSGFQSGVSSPTAQTFYPAQTITYFNGEYVNETDDISTSQFLYSPADVRRFLGYPTTGSVVIPSDPVAGTGTITDDPNNPDQKNIEINFPSLDWLADAINSILDFLRNALTTLADLLTQLLDAILGLFSDAFASLADFGQGIIEFLQSVFAGLSTLLNGYVPSDLAVIIACFIALNFGIGLITFILKGH